MPCPYYSPWCYFRLYFPWVQAVFRLCFVRAAFLLFKRCVIVVWHPGIPPQTGPRCAAWSTTAGQGPRWILLRSSRITSFVCITFTTYNKTISKGVVLLILLSSKIGYTAGVATCSIIRSSTVDLYLYSYSKTVLRWLRPQWLACIGD